MLSEDIASAVLCDFPYREAEKIRERDGLLEEKKSTLNCPSESPTARYLPSREKQRPQMICLVP